MHSAIGKAIEDPRNPGTYLINESARIGAIRERRPCPTALGEHVPRAARARGIGLVPGGEPDDDPGRD